jgi:hypothetical protein
MTRADTDPSIRAGTDDAWFTPGRFALLLGLLIVATFPAVVLGGRSFITRDFGMFGYPLAYFHRESFWQGELPFWNPFNYCGLPFLAQWNTLTLYPPSLIYLVLPLTWSLSFFCLAHLFWGGLGMYFLTYGWTDCRPAAALAGVIYAFNGLSLNALMWPNVEATLGWLPWVVWLVQRAWREGGKALVWAVLAGAMQMLAGGPEPILFTWLILLVLACGDWLNGAKAGRRILLRFALMGALVALVCAAQLLPFLQLLAHSQRDRGFGSLSSDWSLPPWGWANFLVPLFRTARTAQGMSFQWTQSWTTSYYAGIGTVLLGAVAVWRAREWRVAVLAVLLVLGLVLALGDNTVLYRALCSCLPGIGLLRYPVKGVILVLAIAPMLAAFGVAAVAGQPQRAGRFECGWVLLMLLLIGAIVAWDWKAPLSEELSRATWQSGLSRAALLVLVLLLGAVFLRSRGRRQTLLVGLLLALFWLDLVTHAPAQTPTVQPFVFAPGLANAELKWDPPPRLGQSRAMLAPKARELLFDVMLPGQEETYLRDRLAVRADCNLLDDVPQIDGFFSLAPREIFRVTTLPYEQADQSFPGLLDFLGISQTTVPGKTIEWKARSSAMALVTAGQRPLFANDSTAFQAFYQTNFDFRQIVNLPPEARTSITATRQSAARVLEATFTNHKVSIRTDAPAACLLVISQTYYPAWKALVDGQPTRIWRANYAFQAVQVPAGKHQVILIYQDLAFLAGAISSGLGLLACGGLWLGSHFRKRLPGTSLGRFLPS